MDERYFDAKFEGLEKLMASQDANMKGYVGAVSSNVKRVADDLATHKESMEAHGIGSSRSSASVIASWLGLGVAVVVGLIEFVKGHRP